MSKRHDPGFLQRREKIVRQLDDAVHAYETVTDDHERQLIATTAFRRAGRREQGKSACVELTLRCYPDGTIELEPRLHTPEAPRKKSELYNPSIAIPSVVGAVGLLARRGIAEAQTYITEPASSERSTDDTKPL